MARDKAVYVLFAAFVVFGCWWNLPCVDTWASDSVSPRVSGLGSGLAETYAWGSYFTYPPLHLLLLGALALPVIGCFAVTAPQGADALRLALVHAPAMTIVEVTTRLVTFAMALGVIRNVWRMSERLWDARVAFIAGLAVACNPIFVYYAHTGNLEVPSLFWATLALDELVRVTRGESRERRAMLYVAFAVLTKDQAAAMLLLPVLGVIVRRRAWAAIGLGALTYLLVSGAVVNPLGWARRVAFLLGPASRDWTPYDSTAAGLGELCRDVALNVWRSGGALAAVAVGIGVRVAARSQKRGELLPLAAASSFVVLFTFGARRSEERFLLPPMVLLAPFVGVAFASVKHARRTWALAALTVAWPTFEVLRVDATLAMDARPSATRYLETLPPRTPVEVYGANPTLPRLPSGPEWTRVGTENPASRGIHPAFEPGRDVRVDAIDPAGRNPQYLVVSSHWATHFEGGRTPIARRWAEDREAASYFELLAHDAHPTYRRVATFRCVLPFGFACRRIHSSTGDEIWVFQAASRRAS